MNNIDSQNQLRNIYHFLKQKYRKHRKIFNKTFYGITALLLYNFASPTLSSIINPNPVQQIQGALDVKIPTIRFGFALDTFSVAEDKIQPSQTLSEILEKYGISMAVANEAYKQAKKAGFKSIATGKKYTVLSKDLSGGIDYFIYQPDVFTYYIFDFKGEKPTVKKVDHPVEIKIQEASGTIDGTLWETMAANGIPDDITDKMEDALKFLVDFHHFQEGDRFKLLYEEKFIDGKAVGVGKLLAAYYVNGSGKEYYSIAFDEDGNKGFYTQDGRPMKHGYLKSPLKFSRISSPYGKTRLHPFTKTHRVHFGTDYAAPSGTPIMAVADGTVVECTRNGSCGNYVKIKHDKTYHTSYLHMRSFAKGMRKGARVRQGQVIGYVGSTGWATGPHVCFRMTKNNRPVSPFREKLPSATPLGGSSMKKFKTIRDQYLAQIKEIPYLTPEQVAAAKASKEAKVKP